MKKINEMTDVELQERLEFLKEIDSPSTKELYAELFNEKAAREKVRKEKEEKEKAERIRKEIADAEEAKKKNKEMRRKQHDVLGKYFKIKDAMGEVYYKVIGVLGTQAFLECVSKCQFGTYSSTYTSHFTRSIDFLLEHCDEVSEDDYLAQANKSETDLASNVSGLCNGAIDLYDDIMKDFTRTLRTWF